MKRIVCITVVVLGLASAASACPTCKEAVVDDPTAASTAGGFNKAIWVMLAGAGVGVATVAGALVGPRWIDSHRR